MMTTTTRGWTSARLGTHIPALDGLRGIAVLLVLLTHFVQDGGLTPIATSDNLLYDVATRGWIGVDLFFVLSGFLITGILLDAKGGAGYFRNFYLRRTLRIFPLYYAFLALWLLVLPLAHTVPQADVPSSQLPVWTYLVNVAQALHDNLDVAPAYTGHFWSLAVEEQFYLVWPAIVFLCTPRQLAITAVGCIVAAPVLRAVLTLGGYPVAAYVLMPARMDALAVGALLALAMRTRGGIPLSVRSVRGIAGASAAVFLAAFWLPLPEKWSGPLSQLVTYSALAIGFGALLLLALAEPGRTITARVCARPALRFFGRYSYALYVVHPAVAYFIERYVFTVNAAPAYFGTRVFGQLVFIVIAGTASVAVALASWHLLEKRFLALKTRFPYGAAPARAPAVPAGVPASSAGARAVETV